MRLYTRSPSLTLLQALSRIGGVIAWVKVLSFLIYLLHGFIFERRLVRVNQRLEEGRRVGETDSQYLMNNHNMPEESDQQEENLE
jgi:heme/copper-type cytochrome/quinol oxidase subunit 1